MVTPTPRSTGSSTPPRVSVGVPIGVAGDPAGLGAGGGQRLAGPPGIGQPEQLPVGRGVRPSPQRGALLHPVREGDHRAADQQGRAVRGRRPGGHLYLASSGQCAAGRLLPFPELAVEPPDRCVQSGPVGRGPAPGDGRSVVGQHHVEQAAGLPAAEGVEALRRLDQAAGGRALPGGPAEVGVGAAVGPAQGVHGAAVRGQRGQVGDLGVRAARLQGQRRDRAVRGHGDQSGTLAAGRAAAADQQRFSGDGQGRRGQAVGQRDRRPVEGAARCGGRRGGRAGRQDQQADQGHDHPDTPRHLGAESRPSH